MSVAEAKLTIHSARYMGNAPRIRTDQWTVIGQDGGQSVDLGDKTLFMFSDTLLANYDASRRTPHSPPPIPSPLGTEGVFRANTAGISSGSDFQTALTTMQYFLDEDAFPRLLLATTEPERFRRIRFWPEHGFFLNGQVYIYYLGIQTTDPSSIWGFRNIGAGLAVLDVETGECTRLRHNRDWRLWKLNEEDCHFGVQTLVENGTVYVFLSTRKGLTHVARLARVRCEDVTLPDAYEYLSSPEPDWRSDPNQACSLGEASSDYSVSFNRYLGKYIMIYVDGGKKRLMLRAADHPWGPYSEPNDLLGLPCQKTSDVIYLGFEHSKFSELGGKKVYISYSQPNFSLNSFVSLSFR
jgi:hypothetical protein